MEQSVATLEWSDQSDAEVSGGAAPPLPLGAHGNRRFKTAEKILSFTRYLAVTLHRQNRAEQGANKGPSETRPVRNGNTETKCIYRYTFGHLTGIWRTSEKNNLARNHHSRTQKHTHCSVQRMIICSCFFLSHCVMTFFLWLCSFTSDSNTVWMGGMLLLLLSQIPMYPLSCWQTQL